MSPRSSLRPAPAASALVLAFCVCAAGLCVLDAGAYFEEGFEQRFFLEENGLITDHSLVRIAGDGWHLFYAVGVAGEGWMFPNNMVSFGHATSDDLIHWTLQPRVLSTLPGTWKNRNLFAPHVIEDPGNGYLMYYTGLDSAIVQATGVATSPDLYDWLDLSIDAPAYHPDPSWASWSEGQWSDGRDPFAFRLDGGIALLSTAMASAQFTGSTEKGALSFAESVDGVTFTDLGSPFFVNNTSAVLESSSLFRRPNGWFLFYHEANIPGIQYMTSPSLFGTWDKSGSQFLDPFAFGAGDIVFTGQSTLFSRVIDADLNGSLIFGAKIDTVQFTSDTAFYGQQNTLWDRWQVLQGDAFEIQPTFGDRPFARGGGPSGIEGYFLLNTSERYDGPLGIEDPAAAPAYGATGTLLAEPFQVTGGHMSLWVGGGNDPDSLYVALVSASSGEILHRATGGNSDELFLRTWDLSGLAGQMVSLAVVDLRTDAPLGYVSVDNIVEGPGAGVGIDDAGVVPRPGIRLGAPFPNPILSGARIPLSLDRRARVRLAVYDVQGRLRRLLRDGPLGVGTHDLTWDGRDAAGRAVESGIYFFRLDAPGGASTRKVVVGR